MSNPQVSAGAAQPPIDKLNDDDISPKSQVPPSDGSAVSTDPTQNPEYFTSPSGAAPAAPPINSFAVTATATGSPQKRAGPRIRIKGQDKPLSRESSTRSNATAPKPKLAIPEHPSGSSLGSWRMSRTGRKGSVSSLSFAAPSETSLPSGKTKKTDKAKIRAGSPPPERFQKHVAFDNLPLGDATKRNTTSLTLNVRHKGYQAKRRSRTFLVGVDEHAYSDYALQWLLDELVDDGDEVVCVRVVERSQGGYQEDANKLMDAIIEKNGANRAISVVLEYACGKLHSTFQKLIQIYQPAMLIVGTRGRSLGGLQGLMNTRNSFSKYCLQYSPVPVVVVRPTEKREKKKSKRMNDTDRQTYVRMLSATGGKHESDSEHSSLYELEVKYSADEEAHQVAKELGLPASFDPTIKPLSLNPRTTAAKQQEKSPLSTHTTPQDHDKDETKKEGGEGDGDGEAASKDTLGEGSDSDSDSGSGSDEEEEGEFEVMPGEQALDLDQQERLHDMEVGEAAALLKQNRRSSADSGAAEGEDEGEGKHSRKNSRA